MEYTVKIPNIIEKIYEESIKNPRNEFIKRLSQRLGCSEMHLRTMMSEVSMEIMRKGGKAVPLDKHEKRLRWTCQNCGTTNAIKLELEIGETLKTYEFCRKCDEQSLVEATAFKENKDIKYKVKSELLEDEDADPIWD